MAGYCYIIPTGYRRGVTAGQWAESPMLYSLRQSDRREYISRRDNTKVGRHKGVARNACLRTCVHTPAVGRRHIRACVNIIWWMQAVVSSLRDAVRPLRCPAITLRSWLATFIAYLRQASFHCSLSLTPKALGIPDRGIAPGAQVRQPCTAATRQWMRHGASSYLISHRDNTKVGWHKGVARNACLRMCVYTPAVGRRHIRAWI